MNAVLDHESETSAQVGVGPLISVLRQLADLLHATDDDQYIMKPVGVVNSSIGGHVWHCLDHVDSLLAGICIGEMSYDDRPRGTDVETSRMAALHSIERQEQELQDIGQRGAGVKLVRTMSDVANYLKSQPGAVIVQTYHAGPFEAGVFYIRMPGEESGSIFPITDRKFPEIVGDGQSTLEQLIWAHPRFRMQAQIFLARHEKNKDRVLNADESFRLAVAGNHCQGTLFLDGSQLITPDLERRFDEIARHFDGFFFGRFDVRYSDVEAFKAGEDLGIVELNGAGAESTNIYDPNRSLLFAYRTLFQQWSLLFRVGDENRRFGQQPTTLWALASLIWSHLRSSQTRALAD